MPIPLFVDAYQCKNKAFFQVCTRESKLLYVFVFQFPDKTKELPLGEAPLFLSCSQRLILQDFLSKLAT